MESTFWQKSITMLLKEMDSSPEGLSSTEASARLAKFGPNEIQEEKHIALILQFLSKFKNPLVIILLTASALSAFTGDAASFYIIAIIILTSITLDFVQEYRAGVAVERLRKSVAVSVNVLRDKKNVEIPLSLLVPGDIVLLIAGDLIPCDGRILEAKDFFVNEALLTGEPYPVEKAPDELPGVSQILSAKNSVLLGTSVISGSAKVLICRTGKNTSFGEIAETLTTKGPPTNFEIGINHFGTLIMHLTVFLVLFVILVNTLFHRPLTESFLFALALAVGLTPELLPMIVSVTLSRGAIRMARSKVIVKRLSSIHNLGSMDVFCTDKTGTLTEAKIHLERHVDSKGKDSERVLEFAYLNSYFESGVKSPIDVAILEHKEIDVGRWKKIDEVPFDFERRRVSVLLDSDNGTHRLLIVKGAPEDILRLSTSYDSNAETAPAPMNKSELQKINDLFSSLGKDGFRVLGIAFKEVPLDHPHAVVSDETELIFAGFAAFFDPPKENVKQVLAKMERDHVQVKIITGDNELVTQHVCSVLNFPVKKILTGAEIEHVDEQTLTARVEETNLFCRMTPIQKNRIILALKRRGHVVGYLGDGINDAPSLRSADVGISVESAVDVAKASADMIMLERDLGVLHTGILEGRRTYSNIMKYIMMGSSSSFGNMSSMALASLFLPFLPMLPVQILLNNLLYDVSELPIPLDLVDSKYLKHPRHWNMKFIRNFMLLIGPISSVFDFITFYVMLKVFHANEELFHTGWFIESMATQILVIFIIRTRENPFRSRPNPWLIVCSLLVLAVAILLPYTILGERFGFVAPPAFFFVLLIMMTFFYLLTVEGMKQLFYRKFEIQ